MRSFVSYSAICLLLASTVFAHVPHEGANPNGHKNTLSLKEPAAASLNPSAVATGQEHGLSTEDLQAREPYEYPPYPSTRSSLRLASAHGRAANRHEMAADAHQAAFDEHAADYARHRANGNHEEAQKSLDAMVAHHSKIMEHNDKALLHKQTAKNIRVNARPYYARPTYGDRPHPLVSSPNPYAYHYPPSQAASLHATDLSRQAYRATDRTSMYRSPSIGY